ncbi:pyrimidine reductase family protein [Nakamurella sp. YIM 132087]|uniref:Pyrimidine reductase family protein n=1 Tax=Nakamurella alba TaxID=2665158 RepID=A0A7K1FIQ2_9ACTN|nr:dihydrofolate reductase family protein [Nakamurella alba]MTD14005.1 pyrimidine reductase family protein [Nakamurella alba]
MTDRTDILSGYEWPVGPWTRANMITSMDGRAALDGVSGGLGNDTDQEILRTLRDGADVLLVGSGTVRAEGYEGIGTERPAGRPLRLAVVTGRGLPDGLRAIDTAAARPLLLTTTVGAARTPADIAAEIVVLGADHVDATAIVPALRERGLCRVLCEGGPSLLGELIAARRIDELCLTIAPFTVGAGAAPLLGPDSGPAARWALAGTAVDGDHLFTRYRRT